MKGREAFQELDYGAVFGTMAKWVVEIDRAERIPELLSRAWVTAVSGRPGPVVVALPEDMLTSLTDAPPLDGPVVVQEAAPSAKAVEDALALLRHSDRPLILLGGCNWTAEARAAMQAFAEGSDMPVIAAFRYQDQFDNHSAVYAGEAGVGMPAHVKDLIGKADSILAVNVRFGEMTTDGYTLLDVPSPKQRLIHVHGDAAELGKIYRPALAIQAGPNAFVRALQAVQGPWADWRAEARAGYLASLRLDPLPSPVDMGEVTAHLRAVLPEDAIVTNGAGNFAVWPNKFLQYGIQGRLLAPQSGAMGYGVPAAIAAKVAYPEKLVVCFAGDGDFQMTAQELATARQEGAQPVILILNNGIYGTIRAHQEREYPARVSGTGMVNPDFVMLARAHGFHAERVEVTEAFPEAFARAVASPTGAVLDLAISPEALTPRASLSAIRAAALARRQALGAARR
jgi:acetolactate synthase-1/2/3 large subunit